MTKLFVFAVTALALIGSVAAVTSIETTPVAACGNSNGC
jgi:hypothetical protein